MDELIDTLFQTTRNLDNYYKNNSFFMRAKQFLYFNNNIILEEDLVPVKCI